MTSRPRTRAKTALAMGAAASRLRSSNAMNETSYVKTAAKIGTCILCGGIFGVATEKGKVFVPEIVSSQMLLEKFVMMKMFLSALASGMFAFSLLSMLPFTRKMYLDARAAYCRPLSNKGLLSVVLGAFMLGAGLYIVGTCPGLMFVQIGAGTQNAGYTCLGIFLGVVVYGFVEPYISEMTKPKSALTVQFLNQWHESPYFVLSLPMAAMISLGVFSLELFYPSSQELGLDLSATTGSTLMSAPAWPPFFCGCLVGLLQIPMVLVMKDTLGGSSFYCTVVSQGLVTEKLKKCFPYLVKFQKGFENWWQALFFGGAFAGSLLSATLSGTYGTVTGVSPVTAVAGGFLVIFGARLANGCTSGHGLSGVGLLNILSMTATVSMFAGGVVTALTSKYIL